MSKDEIAKLEYINTPFSYTRQQQGLTLLQQNIMVRISAHLQHYFEESWKNKELRESREDPRTFMTDEQIEKLGPIRVELSELGISAGTYERVKEVRQNIQNITFNGIIVDEEGKKDRTWNIISHIDIPVTDHGTTVTKKVRETYTDEEGRVHKKGDMEATEVGRARGYMDIHLNKALVKSMFNTASGYVSHPENIAQIGRVPNMPLMYYFVRHHMNNFKDGKDGKPITTATVDLKELREYLGMTKKNAKGEVVQEKYPTYSQFKSKVLKVALDDIKRICDEGLIDFYFTVQEIRPRGKQKGTPSRLVFEKVHVANEQEKIDYRKASTKKLCNFLFELYPTLDEAKLLQFLTAVSDDLWDDFKAYAYKGVPEAVERPHRWNGTHEEFVYYIMEQWIKQHKPKPEPVQQDLFAQEKVAPKESKPKAEVYEQRHIVEWNEVVAAYDGEGKDALLQGVPLGVNELGMLVVEFPQEVFDRVDVCWNVISEAFKKKVGIKHGPGVQKKRK